jgi:hypothetical protein
MIVLQMSLIAVLFLATCSDESAVDFSLFIDSSFFVKQGSGQCGPTSFYMIFKFYGDHIYSSVFREMPGCSEAILLQEDLTEVTEDSGVSTWLGVTDYGITITELTDKITNLADDACGAYYHVEGNTDDSLSDNSGMFSQINKHFLNRGFPIIAHLERPDWMGLPLFSGHYIVVAGYNETEKKVYYVDPNKNDDDPAIQSVPLSDFLKTDWYRSPDYSLTYPIPDAYWDGTWAGFYRAQ